MKKSALGLITSSLLIFTACAQQKPGGEVVTYYPKPLNENGIYLGHKEYTLFDIGRTLSHNAVDIFDPELTTFNLPLDPPKIANPLASFPAHPYMLMRDDDVVVYSMYSAGMLDTAEYKRVVDDVIPPPIPLVEDGSPLPP